MCRVLLRMSIPCLQGTVAEVGRFLWSLLVVCPFVCHHLQAVVLESCWHVCCSAVGRDGQLGLCLFGRGARDSCCVVSLTARKAITLSRVYRPAWLLCLLCQCNTQNSKSPEEEEEDGIMVLKAIWNPNSQEAFLKQPSLSFCFGIQR